MKKIILYISIIMLNSLFFSCKTTQKEDIVVPATASAGVSVKHHGILVQNCDVYLKLNTNGFIGYDYKLYDKTLATDTLAHVTFENLPIGTHHIMVLGFDRTINDDVLGQKEIKISRIDQKIEIDVAVSEVH